MAEELEATQCLVNDLRKDLKREYEINRKMQVVCDEASVEITRLKDDNSILEEENDRLRRDRDQARKIAEDQERRIAALRKELEQMQETRSTHEPSKQRTMTPASLSKFVSIYMYMRGF